MYVYVHSTQSLNSSGAVTFKRCRSSEPIPPPHPDGTIVYSDKLHSIVKDISQLTLIEVSKLNELLKVSMCLNLSFKYRVHVCVYVCSIYVCTLSECVCVSKYCVHTCMCICMCICM